MSDQAWMAIIISPDGTPWESTANVAIGHEAEFRARRFAEQKFCEGIMGHLFKKGIGRLWSSVWNVARDNGWKCVTSEVDIQK